MLSIIHHSSYIISREFKRTTSQFGWVFANELLSGQPRRLKHMLCRTCDTLMQNASRFRIDSACLGALEFELAPGGSLALMMQVRDPTSVIGIYGLVSSYLYDHLQGPKCAR
jgi:hypothetical protein